LREALELKVKSTTTLAVIWSRFGPYHLARLRGAALAMPNAHVVGLEVAGTDRDYAWDHSPGGQGFERVTIFGNKNYHDLSTREITAGVCSSLDQLRPSVVAINGWGVPEARAALGWTRQCGARAILMSESKADDRARSWWKEAAKRAIVRQFDAALVGGRPQTDYLVSLGFPASKVRLGYDAVDNAHFETGSDAARVDAIELRRKFGLTDRYFFACSRFLERKNLDGLLRGYAQYRTSSPKPWALVLAGSGAEEVQLRRLAEALGIADQVIWPGFVQYSELPIFFGLAGAFIHPAKSEAWGLVVNEAAASGLPLLIARPVGAAAELVRDDETGFLFDPHDDVDIANALHKVAGAPQEARDAWGRNARRLVSQWGPDRFGSELAALLPEVRRCDHGATQSRITRSVYRND
jgi:glycosyltransferase involved in cell wall biosynthesis